MYSKERQSLKLMNYTVNDGSQLQFNQNYQICIWQTLFIGKLSPLAQNILISSTKTQNVYFDWPHVRSVFLHKVTSFWKIDIGLRKSILRFLKVLGYHWKPGKRNEGHDETEGCHEIVTFGYFLMFMKSYWQTTLDFPSIAENLYGICKAEPTNKIRVYWNHWKQDLNNWAFRDK